MTLRDHFRAQANSCRELGSPFTAQLLTLLADRLQPGLPVADHLFAWSADLLGPDAVALRLAGALHALVLQRRDAALVAVYPPQASSDEALWQAVEPALRQHATHILHWLENAPQTNEVRRATALILGASRAAQSFPGLPLRVSELGASAGLNLHFDRFALDAPNAAYTPETAIITLAPEVTGALSAPAPFTVADRRGIDLNPLDPRAPEDVLRLRSYIWADQSDRMARTDAVLAVAEALVDRGDAADWLTERLSAPVPGQIDFLYHTIAWQYFPPATNAICLTAIETAALRATPEAPFAWLSFEADGESPGAPVVLRLWPGDLTLPLGRMDFHGRWFHAQ
ncbi:DUF2332 domain-containing protein [Pseudooceanicola spongiae]|uniref:DUF2332 family protein n=1 Tax=Pseudooceanicola spongiae TaxID=2613965 RepID=A0A7L9WM20_9RHOB|nr:DUF2332 family protein [Pseudooceanicola spongiae]QOL81435.1 DUF2332 family protein [Pseudooceanicola spongiae]